MSSFFSCRPQLWNCWSTGIFSHDHLFVLVCHSCQLKTGNWGHDLHKLTKLGQLKTRKALPCLLNLNICKHTSNRHGGGVMMWGIFSLHTLGSVVLSFTFYSLPHPPLHDHMVLTCTLLKNWVSVLRCALTSSITVGVRTEANMEVGAQNEALKGSEKFSAPRSVHSRIKVLHQNSS